MISSLVVVVTLVSYPVTVETLQHRCNRYLLVLLVYCSRLSSIIFVAFTIANRRTYCCCARLRLFCTLAPVPIVEWGRFPPELHVSTGQGQYSNRNCIWAVVDSHSVRCCSCCNTIYIDSSSLAGRVSAVFELLTILILKWSIQLVVVSAIVPLVLYLCYWLD